MTDHVRPATHRLSARATVIVAAGLVVCVVGLAVALVWGGEWTYSALRQQARGAIPGRPAPHAPAVIGPADTPAGPPPAVSTPGPEAIAPAAPVPPTPPPSETSPSSRPAHALGGERLAMPVDGVAPDALYPSFDEARGERAHEAIDIMAPRGTPVRAVADGRIARLFTSEAGGLTIYQFDRDERLAYYYAHLDRYQPGLAEGDAIRQGDLLAYVGSTGNASDDAPHLHFAVFVLGPEKRWWEGRPIDPYPLLGGTAR